MEKLDLFTREIKNSKLLRKKEQGSVTENTEGDVWRMWQLNPFFTIQCYSLLLQEA